MINGRDELTWDFAHLPNTFGDQSFRDVMREALDEARYGSGIVAEDGPGKGGRENPLLEKSFSFAVEAGRKAMNICRERASFPAGQQLMRSSSSVGANVEEANGAYSPRDFAHKMSIALKESRESHYWIRYCHRLKLLDDATRERLLPKAEELIKILTATMNTLNKRYPKKYI